MSEDETKDHELTWKAAAEIFASERHFNHMQNHCRTLASTWLLAAFAGVGYVYKEKIFDDPALVSALVTLGAAAGVFLLWILDVKIWHRLLLANTLAGQQLEIEHDWMPRIRRNIARSKGWWPVRVHLSLFYGLAIALLICIGSAFLSLSSSLDVPAIAVAAMTGFAFVVLGLMIASAFRSHTRDSSTIKEIAERVQRLRAPAPPHPPRAR